jgi:hypothetical protein
MSRARMQRTKARNAAKAQMTTALATTGRPPMDHTADTPIYAALAAVMPIAPYDPADATLTPWWPSAPAAAEPRPTRPAWAADTDQVYRLDTVLRNLGAGVNVRGRTVRALAAAAAAASIPAADRLPGAPVFEAPSAPPVRELTVAPRSSPYRPWALVSAHQRAAGVAA